jgi:hypothetical protein
MSGPRYHVIDANSVPDDRAVCGKIVVPAAYRQINAPAFGYHKEWSRGRFYLKITSASPDEPYWYTLNAAGERVKHRLSYTVSMVSWGVVHCFTVGRWLLRFGVLHKIRIAEPADPQ